MEPELLHSPLMRSMLYKLLINTPRLKLSAQPLPLKVGASCLPAVLRLENTHVLKAGCQQSTHLDSTMKCTVLYNAPRVSGVLTVGAKELGGVVVGIGIHFSGAGLGCRCGGS